MTASIFGFVSSGMALDYYEEQKFATTSAERLEYLQSQRLELTKQEYKYVQQQLGPTAKWTNTDRYIRITNADPPTEDAEQT